MAGLDVTNMTTPCSGACTACSSSPKASRTHPRGRRRPPVGRAPSRRPTTLPSGSAATRTAAPGLVGRRRRHLALEHADRLVACFPVHQHGRRSTARPSGRSRPPRA
jgi:hypothetical protein